MHIHALLERIQLSGNAISAQRSMARPEAMRQYFDGHATEFFDSVRKHFSSYSGAGSYCNVLATALAIVISKYFNMSIGGSDLPRLELNPAFHFDKRRLHLNLRICFSKEAAFLVDPNAGQFVSGLIDRILFLPFSDGMGLLGLTGAKDAIVREINEDCQETLADSKIWAQRLKANPAHLLFERPWDAPRAVPQLALGFGDYEAISQGEIDRFIDFKKTNIAFKIAQEILGIE
jgi:hypothetical protein